ncbi:MAG: sigma-70 family RNA polymerase sigma factor [Bacteroidaceae bacterium]|nr:sigma-70 family RNA polymerase sigma factor [Bacteroidaceae bacterium]
MTTEEYQQEAARLRPVLLRTALRYLSEEDEAEDIVQEALIRLWNICDCLQRPMDGLAQVTVRNLCIDLMRRNRREMPLDDTDLPHIPEDSMQRIDRMMHIVAQLPTMQQTILRMRHMEGMEYADIASLTGSNEAAVRKALSRARKTVKERYFKIYEDER